MGYRIIYSGAKHRGRMFPLVLLFLAAVLLGVCLVPEGRRAVQAAFIPGNEEATRQAYAVLRSALGKGEDLTRAVARFCRETMTGLD